jgi:hypothetical protein
MPSYMQRSLGPSQRSYSSSCGRLALSTMHALRPALAGIFHNSLRLSIDAKDVKLLGISAKCAAALNQVTAKTVKMTNNPLQVLTEPSRIELAGSHLTYPGP